MGTIANNVLEMDLTEALARDAIFLRDLQGPITYWNPTPARASACAGSAEDPLPPPAQALKAYLERRCQQHGLQFRLRSRLAGSSGGASGAVACWLAQVAVAAASGREGDVPRVRISLAEAAGGIVLEVWVSGLRTDSPLEAVRRGADAAGGWARDAVSPRGSVTIVCWIPSDAPELPALRSSI